MYTLDLPAIHVYIRVGLCEAGSEGKISEEVIEEQFAIVLSRDYASLLGVFIHNIVGLA